MKPIYSCLHLRIFASYDWTDHIKPLEIKKFIRPLWNQSEHVRTGENIKITGDGYVDDDIVIEPHPTCCEVLKAVLTIGACIEGSNDPKAYKLAALFGLLNRQLCLDEIWSMEYEGCLFKSIVNILI